MRFYFVIYPTLKPKKYLGDRYKQLFHKLTIRAKNSIFFIFLYILVIYLVVNVMI